ncbi:Nitrogen assimilation transcription factor nirA [Madurella mycetomatis]|uniref:Nitrogen assimilation transcription factor nirA n=1 Tax=Madurella mycetomatis TaxID=100816 RepID=A0A175WIG3_9PEZI|nr:Nitrogen assimilation transcription factor nirA [Madurella mycetomatis]
MAQPILPRLGGVAPETGLRSVPRREQIKVACEVCRRRKTKVWPVPFREQKEFLLTGYVCLQCDGNRPVCFMCQANGRKCVYINANPAESRSAALKRKHDEARDHVSALEELYALLETRGQQEVNEILRRLRAGSDVESILRYVKAGDLLLQLRLAPEARFRYCFPDFANWPTVFRDPEDPYLTTQLLDVSPTTHPQARISSLPSPPFDTCTSPHVYHMPYHTAHVADPRLTSVKAAKWTSVTTDDALVSKLLAIYLQFDYPTSPCFQKDLFLDDLVNGRTDFCSSLLVNSILATGAHGLTSDPQRVEFWVPHSLSYTFMAEAKRAWRLEMMGKPKLTTIWAALVISLRYGADGADKLGIPFVQKASEMAHEMGLFTQQEKGDTRVSIARAFTAWSLFSWQSFVAPHRSRLSSGLLTCCNSMICYSYFKRPFVAEPPATPLPDYRDAHRVTGEIYLKYPLQRDFTPVHLGLCLKAITELNVIANDINQVRPSPEDPDTPPPSLEQVLGFCERLNAWYTNLPKELHPSNIAMPHQLRIHMEYYHVLIKLLEPWENPAPETPGRDSTVNGRTFQEMGTIARARLETVVRLYYLRHSFEFPDTILNIYLMLLGSISIRTIQAPGGSPAAAGRDAATYLLCLKGLHDQGRSNYLGALMFDMISGLVDPGNASLMSDISRIKGEFRGVEIKPEHVHMEWPVYQWVHPKNVKMGKLLDALDDLSLQGDESEAEPDR